MNIQPSRYQHYLAILTALFLMPIVALGQQSFELQEGSNMVIKGTSTIHDWESTVEQMQADITATVTQGTPQFSEFTLTVVAESIKSGKSGMDDKTYDALNTKKHPHITFKLAEVKEVSESSLTAVGDLTISGQTRTVEFPVNYTVMEEGKASFSGEYSLKMTSYDVDPPKAMFGTIKAGDEVTIAFDITIAPAMDNS